MKIKFFDNFKNCYFWLIILFFVLYFIPTKPMQIYDLTNNGKIATDFSIQKDFNHTFFAPFLDVASYFCQMQNLKTQLLSYVSWFFVINFLIYFGLKFYKKDELKVFFTFNPFPIFFIKLFVILWLLIVYVVFFPYLGNKLQKLNPDDIAVDFHSHTYYSWDAISSFKRSLNYHKSNGFDAYFVTEHNSFLPNLTNVESLKRQDIFVGFGEEVPDSSGVFYLFFNIDEAVSPDELSSANYQKNMLDLKDKNVCFSLALWWEKITLNAILEKDFSSAEIANMGHKNYKDVDLKNAIGNFKKRNITLIGTTDWHGWCYKTNVWTIANIPGWRDSSFDYDAKKNALLYVLAGKRETRVLEYKRNELNSKIRYILDPFFGLFYILTSASFLELLMWFLWVFVVVRFFKAVARDKKMLWVWFAVLGFNVFFSVKFFLTWQKVSKYNEMLGNVSLYFFVAALISGIICFFMWKKQKQVCNKNM